MLTSMTVLHVCSHDVDIMVYLRCDAQREFEECRRLCLGGVYDTLKHAGWRLQLCMKRHMIKVWQW